MFKWWNETMQPGAQGWKYKKLSRIVILIKCSISVHYSVSECVIWDIARDHFLPKVYFHLLFYHIFHFFFYSHAWYITNPHIISGILHISVACIKIFLCTNSKFAWKKKKKIQVDGFHFCCLQLDFQITPACRLFPFQISPPCMRCQHNVFVLRKIHTAEFIHTDRDPAVCFKCKSVNLYSLAEEN